MSGLFWIRTVWHSDGISESFFFSRKSWFWKKTGKNEVKQGKFVELISPAKVNFRETWVRLGGGSAGLIFATMLLHLWFPLFWYATGHCSEKFEFWPLNPYGSGEGSAGKIFATVMMPLWFPLIWYATWLCFEQVEIWPFDPRVKREWGRICGQNICYHVDAFLILYNLICNKTCSEKVDFWPPGSVCVCRGWGLGANYLLPCCCLCDSLEFDMPHDNVLNKLSFDFWPPGSWGEAGSAWEKIATMLLHSWFQLIWYATWPWSETVEFWPFDP